MEESERLCWSLVIFWDSHFMIKTSKCGHCSREFLRCSHFAFFCSYQMCAILKDQLRDIAFIWYSFLPYWMSVSRGRKCGLSPSKSCTDGTTFRVRGTMSCKTPVCTDLKSNVIFIVLLKVLVYFRLTRFQFYLIRWRYATYVLDLDRNWPWVVCGKL